MDTAGLRIFKKNVFKPCQATCLFVNGIVTAQEVCRLWKFWPYCVHDRKMAKDGFDRSQNHLGWKGL